MTNIDQFKLDDLGYRDFLKSNAKIDLEGYKVARVIAEYKELYKVRSLSGEYLAKITGKQNFNAQSREDYPAVGDWVAITALDKEKAVIHKILPRRTILRKKYSGKEDNQIIATNIDVAFIVESLDRDYNLNRFERYIVLSKDGNIKPVIVLNKIDLISDEELQLKISQLRDRFKNVDIISASTIVEKGLAELKNYIVTEKTYCFLGSSGVGKSSLINRLLGKDTIQVGGISYRAQRGKHITTRREMYLLGDGGIVIDNPGMREVGLTDSHDGVEDVFSEIHDLSKYCKFVDCTHTHEPGCAVLNAVKSKEMDKGKYSNYIELKKETEHYDQTEIEKRRKNRKFGKFIHKAKKDIKKYKP